MTTAKQSSIGTPIIDTSGSETTKQRRTIPLEFIFPDNIVTTSPIEENITVSVDSVEVVTTNNTTPATQDYVVTLKIHQVISYCTKALWGGFSSRTRNKTYYDTFVFPKVAGNIPNFAVTYDFDVYTNFDNYIVPNVAKKYNHTIAVSTTNETATQDTQN